MTSQLIIVTLEFKWDQQDVEELHGDLGTFFIRGRAAQHAGPSTV